MRKAAPRLADASTIVGDPRAPCGRGAKNDVVPASLLLIVAFAAVELFKKLVELTKPLLIVAFAAVELSKNLVD